MTGLLRAPVSGDTLLSRRSRLGDRGAASRLAARHLERVTELSAVVGGGPERGAALAQPGFALALRGTGSFDDALISAFARLAATTDDPDGARGRLLALLVEVEHRSLDEVAALLGLGPEAAHHLLPSARTSAGVPPRSRHCRGWGLVARHGLTPAERHAGQDHLALCRRCRDRFAELERTRAQLVGGTAGLAVGLTSTHLLGGAGAGFAGSGLGAVLGSKAVAGLVAVVGGAVLVTGGAAAVVQQPSQEAGYGPAVVSPAPQPAGPQSCTTCPAPRSAPTGTMLPPLPTVTVPVTVPPVVLQPPTVPLPVPLPALRVPLPALPTLPEPRLPLPPLPLPALPLPTQLPVIP
ncbi:MAG TPA: hypothetical protein VM097_03595 [Mycobacteriales bacterium]|nr:hypothetical protein [Mycobacteriales bacterium]